jgi:hypothetical protein
MIRPLPDLTNSAYLLKLGREHALRDARFDALKMLRDAVTKINSGEPEREVEGLAEARQSLDRLEELARIAAA